jgi:predicted PurR-regulated permease PerM
MKKLLENKWIFYFTLIVASIIVFKFIDVIPNISGFIAHFCGVISPLLIAILMAYILYQPCKIFERIYFKSNSKFIKTHTRGLSTLTVYLLAFVVIVVILNFVVPAISKNLTDLVVNAPEYYKNSITALENAREGSILHSINRLGIIESYKELDIEKLLGGFIKPDTIMNYLGKIMSVAKYFVNFFVALILSIYLLLERYSIKCFLQTVLKKITNKKIYEKIKVYYNMTNEIFSNFLSMQLLDSFIVAILLFIVFSLLGIKYAIVLAFLIGLMNLIPYFGAIIGITAAGVVTLITMGLPSALLLVAVAAIVQQIDANVINPKLLSNAVNLSPILVIVSVTVGGAYFGPIGMFLSVPICAVLKVVVMDSLGKGELKNGK